MTDTDRDFIADKEREYRLYLIWQHMPHDIPEKNAKNIFATDEELLALSQIKTQKALASYLKVRPSTITDWKNQPVPKQYEELDFRYWAKKVTGQVAGAVFRELLKNGDAARANWFMTHVNGYEPKSRHAITGANGEDFLGGLADLIAGADKVLEDHGETVE